MTWQQLYLSFAGRMARGRYWLTNLVLLLITGAIFMVAAFLPPLAGASLEDETIFLVGAAGMVILAYPSIALAVKRLHDRGKSGWWLVAMYVPPAIADASLGEGAEAGFISLAFGLWALIELGFLRGTPGPNRFGPDPLEARP